MTATAPTTSLNAASSTGAGASVDIGSPRRMLTMQCIVTGSPSAAVVNLEASLDNVNFTALGQWSLTGGQATGGMISVAGHVVEFARANLLTLSGGSSPTVTALIASAGGIY